jgi:hypothetical protein
MFRTVLVGLIIAIYSGVSHADIVHAPVSVSSPFGEHFLFPLENIINQSGLSDTYTSGTTDFDSFSASTTHSPNITLNNIGFTDSSTHGPQHFTFDLGALVPVSSIAIWNSDVHGAISSFELLADDDEDLYNGIQGSILGSTSLSSNDPNLDIPADAQVFRFETSFVRFIHFNGLSTLLPPDNYALAEIVFGVVPAPGTGLVLSSFLCVSYRRRRAVWSPEI